MTLNELNAALDAMATNAGGDPDQMPGLITFRVEDWVPMPMFATVKSLDDKMRHRDIVIQVGSQQRTAVLTRAEAGDRGAPYRDLLPQP